MIFYFFCGYPPPPQSWLGHTVNEWPVRILLECILVTIWPTYHSCFLLFFHFYQPQGKAMFSQLSVCPQSAPWLLVMVRPCCGAVSTHPTGMLSCFCIWNCWINWWNIKGNCKFVLCPAFYRRSRTFNSKGKKCDRLSNMSCVKMAKYVQNMSHVKIRPKENDINNQ